MYFLVIGRDGKDEAAAQRRLNMRTQHLTLAEKNIAAQKLCYASAILDNNENMIGSMMVFNFPNRAALDEYLKSEPYVIGKVWHEIDISLCQPAKFFL